MEKLDKAHNGPLRWAFYIGIFLLLIAIVQTSAIYAAENADLTILKQLKAYEIDSVSTILDDAMRKIGFGIAKFLGGLADSLYDSIGKIYKLLTFGSSEQMVSLVRRYSTLYRILFIVSVTFFGIYLLCGKNTNQLNTVNCILIIALVVMAMPLFTSKLTKLTVSSADFARNQWIETTDAAKIQSIASSVLAANIVDLQKVDQSIKGTTIKGLKKNQGYNSLKTGSKEWRYLNINEPMDYDEDLKQDFWNQQLIRDQDGTYDKKDMEAWFDIGNSYYYRYQILSWFNVLALLGTVVFILFFVCIKCGKIVIDVAMANVYMPFVAITDLTSGQRIKEAIKNFLVLFAVLFLCIALVGVYFAGFAFINANVSGTIPNLVMHIALAWAILDGPNVIERIAGVDAGFKGIWQKLMGLRAATALAGGAAKAGAAAAKGTAKATNAAAGAVFGAQRVSEAKDKMKEAAGKTMRQATDGKGLIGFGKNAAKGAQDRLTPKDSTKGVERNAKNADPDFGKAKPRENPAKPMQSAGKPKSAKRPDRSQENLQAMKRSGQARSGIRPVGGAAKQAARKSVGRPPKTIQRPQARQKMRTQETKKSNQEQEQEVKGHGRSGIRNLSDRNGN